MYSIYIRFLVYGLLVYDFFCLGEREVREGFSVWGNNFGVGEDSIV